VGGLPVCVNALAGCGKTTTIALLCNALQQRHPSAAILYLVFNKKNQEEAMESGKFPKENMEIRTAHAFVLRYYFGTAHMNSFSPENDYDLDDIVDKLRLREYMMKNFPDDNHLGGTFLRKVKSVALFVRKTLHNFQASAEGRVDESHIFWRARDKTNLTKRSQWRGQIPTPKYKEWAAEFFKIVQDRCHAVRDQGGRVQGISYDGYLKVAQLECDLTGAFQFVIADEAQDLTPCQADLFWGDPFVRKDRAIYLFGDRYQMLYRFRGASHSFFHMWEQSPYTFNLTGSFRFGETIAKTASIVLEAVGGVSGDKLVGRAESAGQVHDEADFGNHGTVLCRTNQGIYSYLFFNRPSRWTHLSGAKEAFHTPPTWVFALESFLQTQKKNNVNDIGNPVAPEEDDNIPIGADTFLYKGERFSTVQDIIDYIDDEGDMDLAKYLQLLQFLKAQQQSLDDFLVTIRESFCPLAGNDPTTFDGVVIGTVHKAKGLEFPRVLIYDDFKFKVIESQVINESRHCDEGSILYVALTRAEEHLFLTAAARECLNGLAETLGVDGIDFSPYRNMKEIRCDVDEQWKEFKSQKPEIHSLLDIPWPGGELVTDDNVLGLDREMTEAEQRQYIRALLLRYHPDRFLAAFGRLISYNDAGGLRDKIIDQLNAIVQKCMETLRQLQNVDES